MKSDSPQSSVTARKVTPLALACVWPWIAICLLLSGCERAADTTKLPDINGTYTLVTINGNKLPYTPPHEGGAPQVTSGTFTIRSDGTCSSQLAFVLPSGKASSREVSATYTREGSKLNLQWQGAGRTTGTIEGTTFTMDNEGTLFAYRK